MDVLVDTSVWISFFKGRKDVSYFYNHKFYEKVKEKGGLQ